MSPKPLLFPLSIAVLSAISSSACKNDEVYPGSGRDAQVIDVVDDSDTGAGGSGGDMGTGGQGMGPAAPAAVELGKSCLGDSDCAEGLTCITTDSSDFLGGGPAGGYCSLKCDTPTDCEAFDRSGRCLEFDAGLRYCLQGCEAGATLLTKCQGRLDISCQDSDGGGFCRPTCRGDEDCDGRRCELGTGLCVDELSDGGEIGAECDPDDPTTCSSGLCIAFADGYFACSGLCQLGDLTAGCGRSAAPMSPSAPACVLAPETAALGDLARCNQGCDCQDDCLHPDALCYTGPFGSLEDGSSLFGTKGLCVAPNETFSETDQFAGPCRGGSNVDGGDGSAPASDGGSDAAAAGSGGGSNQTEDAAAAGSGGGSNQTGDAAAAGGAGASGR